MEYSEKMYEESKRPKMDYKRAGQEAREGGMSFKDGGKVDGCSSSQVSGRKSGKTY
jgi:hypothetical protein